MAQILNHNPTMKTLISSIAALLLCASAHATAYEFNWCMNFDFGSYADDHGTHARGSFIMDDGLIDTDPDANVSRYSAPIEFFATGAAGSVSCSGLFTALISSGETWFTLSGGDTWAHFNFYDSTVKPKDISELFCTGFGGIEGDFYSSWGWGVADNGASIGHGVAQESRVQFAAFSDFSPVPDGLGLWPVSLVMLGLVAMRRVRV